MDRPLVHEDPPAWEWPTTCPGVSQQAGDPIDNSSGTLADDRDDWDSAVLAVREQQANDGLADRPRRIGPRGQVQAQAGAGVDLDDHPILLLERAGDVHGHDVDPRHIQAHDPRGRDGAVSDLGVEAIRDIVGDTARDDMRMPTHRDADTGRWDRIGRVALLGKHFQRRSVERDPAERGQEPIAAAGVLVDRSDNVSDRGAAISLNLCGLAPGGRNNRPSTTSNR